MRSTPVTSQQRRCSCGALSEPGKRRCLKCRFRASWFRRKARRRQKIGEPW